jgi:hypothetical protein
MNADVYGQHDADSIWAASDPVVTDLSDVGGLFYMGASAAALDGNLPAAAWQQLCAREASLQPGQGLLPPLQQQLIDTLGCNSKGFLWLAPVWKARHLEGHVPAAVHVCALIADSLKEKMRSSAAVGSGRSPPAKVTDTVLQLFLLLPALALRMELHQQRACSNSGAGQEEHRKNMYHTVTVSGAAPLKAGGLLSDAVQLEGAAQHAEADGQHRGG